MHATKGLSQSSRGEVLGAKEAKSATAVAVVVALCVTVKDANYGY